MRRPSFPNRVRLVVERLEDRCLLQAGDWTAIGPDPQTQDVKYENVSGRVSTLTYVANFYGAGHAALLEGSASGGLDVSSDLNAAGFPGSLAWYPLTDRVGLTQFDPSTGRGVGALRVGAVAVDLN